MFEIFKTNVDSSAQAKSLLLLLHNHFPSAEINFDLEDCDHILRVKGDQFSLLFIIQLMADQGFECRVLA